MEDYSTIQPIPEVPDKIKEAVNNKKFAVFIGAGVSRIIGCMGWHDLASNLINCCFKTSKTNRDDMCINFKEKETLLLEHDNKKIITICRHILCENNKDEIFYEKLEEALKPDNDLKEKYDIYREIYGLGGVNITVNIDENYDEKFDKPFIISSIGDFSHNTIDRKRLYKLHGTISCRKSLVLTLPEYMRRYKDNNIRDFLTEIFTKYTVLFIGYGMSEFELLDFLFTRFDTEAKNKEIKHYMLFPCYSGGENILRYEQYYYGEIGIQAICYQKDERGYEQLYHVLEAWNSRINMSSNRVLDIHREIEELLSNNKYEDILQLIKNSRIQEDHLFKTLTAAAAEKSFQFLEPLKKARHFAPDKNPEPVGVINQPGLYTVPPWNILPYLENCAQQNSKNPSDKHTKLLLDIINPIIDYEKTEKRKDNRNTNLSLVKIIFLLPLDNIGGEHIEFVRMTIHSKWSNTLILMVTEINSKIIPKLLERKSEKLLTQLLEIIIDYMVKTYIAIQYIPPMDEYFFEQMRTQHQEGIIKLCGIDISEIALKKWAYNPSEKDRFFSSMEANRKTQTDNISAIEKELLSKPVKDVIDYIDNSPSTKTTFDEFDGISYTLKRMIRKNPKKFTDDIEPILKAKPMYQHAFLWGIYDALVAKADIDWGSVFKFIHRILDTNASNWREKDREKTSRYKEWIISAIVNLINTGLKEEHREFNPRFLPDAEKLLLLLVDIIESSVNEIHDIIHSVLNSNKGKIFMAMINYSRKYAREHIGDGGAQKWVQPIRDDFTKRLDKTVEPSLEFSAVLGQYLPILYDLDKGWVISNIEKIFLKENQTHWQAAFVGYLSWVTNVDQSLYKFLAEKGHYEMALRPSFAHTRPNEGLAQHICVAYIHGWEDINKPDSLICKLIRSGNTKYLDAVIEFFSEIRDQLTQEMKDKIKPLWQEIYSQLYKNKENTEYHGLILNTAGWILLVDTIDDDIFKYLNLPIIHITTVSFVFIEGLLKHVRQTPKKVANLFLEMLNNKVYPDYKREHILDIITILARNGLKGEAIKICNIYLHQGYDFVLPALEEIYKN